MIKVVLKCNKLNETGSKYDDDNDIDEDMKMMSNFIWKNQ